MTNRNSEPPTAAKSSRWSLPAFVWSPVVVILLSIATGLGVAYAMKDSGGLTVIRSECDPLEDGCELRQTVHWHADFAIYIDGERFAFDDPEYISTESDEKSDAAHIHNPRHTVVHVHLEQTTWKEFLTSIGFDLRDPSQLVSTAQTQMTLPDGTVLATTDAKTFKFFVNGVRVDGIAGMDISDLDRVLISYGDESLEDARAQFDTVSDQACIPSELCRDRLPPGGVEEEPCSKSGTTCN